TLAGVSETAAPGLDGADHVAGLEHVAPLRVHRLAIDPVPAAFARAAAMESERGKFGARSEAGDGHRVSGVVPDGDLLAEAAPVAAGAARVREEGLFLHERAGERLPHLDRGRGHV